MAALSKSKSFACALIAIGATVAPAQADEGGVSFWLPGMFTTLAAAPAQPGLGFQTIYIHTQPSADSGKSFPRGGRVETGLDARVDLLAFGPSYTFATPVFGAQAAVSVLGIYGHSDIGIDATLTGPLGRSITGAINDERAAFGDLIPMASLKWNRGVHNYMTYVTGAIPVGAYDPNRLANLGIGHGAIDGGFAYTYFNPQTGWEATAALGFTYNFRNPDTDYKNGIDGHLDWGVSRFITPQVQLGVVGYLFQQVSDDSGSSATLGGFRSRVAGVGPQLGFMFPVGGMQGYLNFKGFKEFAAENRPEGWNAWVTFVISPAAAPPPAPATSRLVHK